MRRAHWILAPAAAAALLGSLAACGGSGGGGDAPPAAALASDVVSKAQDASSAHYALDGTISLAMRGKVSSSILRAIAAGPVELRLEGGATHGGLTADGTVRLSGQTLPVRLVVGTHAFYVRVLGQWFGTRKAGLDNLLGMLGRKAGTTDLRQAVRDHLGEAVSGAVSGGPSEDGVDTWRLEGTLNAEGLAKLYAQVEGEPLSANERAALDTLAQSTRVVLDTGRDDRLPRHVELGLKLGEDAIAKLDPGGKQLPGVRSLDVELSADLSQWGAPVEVRPPASFQSLDKLLKLLSGL